MDTIISITIQQIYKLFIISQTIRRLYITISEDHKQTMKQTSLLDSFLKKSNKKQVEKSQSKKEELNQPIVNSQLKISKKKWTNLDSDEDEDYIENCQAKLEDIKLNDPRNTAYKLVQSYECLDVEPPIEQEDFRKSKRERKSEGKSLAVKKGDADDNFFAQFTDATPIWAQKQHCQDAQMRSPNHPEYDPTTLHIPDEAWSKFTASMKQFWKIKSQNFQKVILFKLGKFYQLFYDDASIGNKYLDLKYMGTKMHSGFPEKSLNIYTKQLVKLGFKTVIVQQMQTPQQMQDRMKSDKAQGRKSEKTLNREITQILTKGTVATNDQDITYLPNYLLSLRLYGQTIAFSLLEMSENKILLGIVDNIDQFKTILFQTRPAEVVFDPDNVPFDMLRMMQQSFLQMQISKVVNKNNLWHPLNAICELQKLQKQGKVVKGKIFNIINTFNQTNKNLVYATLSGLFDYLKKVFKFEYIITSVRFIFYQKENHINNMTLDSQALQHLQIFQTTQGQKGSLFNIIDKTKTKFGKRLLRRWIMSPLMNTYHIGQRLNAIEDLQEISVDREKVSNIFKKLPDMEKKINKLYHYAIKTTSASKAIYFEDVHTSRLKQFRQIMEKMEIAWEAINILSAKRSNLRSNRLKQLITLTKSIPNENQLYEEQAQDQSSYEGILPDVIDSLQQFKSFVKWEKNIPVPQKGLAAGFDSLQQELEGCKKQLEEYIQSIRYQMNQPNLKFTHTKQRYQIEIPQKSEKRRPKNFEFTSKRAGFSRYASATTRNFVKTLEKIQESVKQQMGLFIGFFFEEFKKKQKIWQRYIQILAEIDCLISISEYSFMNSKTRPNFSPQDEPTFEIIAARHPCLTHIDFIPNDIILNRKVMLLTGPNMGGKSTILRTACILAILAQIGSYVPAQRYYCETVDRIFTRIGASDKLELGKSTFFIEMQETKSIITHGTKKSLAIIDQLGRGTSTFDGMAIAYSVLRGIIHQIQCYCMFATHYHILVEQFEKKPEVALMMMDSLIKNDELIFLYKLVEGHVQQSFGLNVAKLVGISPQTIQLASRKAQQMNIQIEDKRTGILEEIYDFIK